MKPAPFFLLLVLVCAAGLWMFCSQRQALAAARTARSERNGAAPSPKRAGDSRPSADQPSPSSELLRLRGEVGVLRRQLAETDPQEQIRRQYTNDWNQVYAGPRPSEHPDFFSYKNLADVGSATPDQALQTFYHTMMNQRAAPLTDSRMMELWDVPDDYDQPPGYNIHIGEGFYGGSGFRIVERQPLSSNSLRVTLDYEKEDGSSYRRDKILVQRNGRWRMKPESVTRANPPAEEGQTR